MCMYAGSVGTFVKLVERWTLDIRRIFEIRLLEYSAYRKPETEISNCWWR